MFDLTVLKRWCSQVGLNGRGRKGAKRPLQRFPTRHLGRLADAQNRQHQPEHGPEKGCKTLSTGKGFHFFSVVSGWVPVVSSYNTPGAKSISICAGTIIRKVSGHQLDLTFPLLPDGGVKRSDPRSLTGRDHRQP